MSILHKWENRELELELESFAVLLIIHKCNFSAVERQLHLYATAVVGTLRAFCYLSLKLIRVT